MRPRSRCPHSRRADTQSLDASRRLLLSRVGIALGLALITDARTADKLRKLQVEIAAGNAPVTLTEFVKQTGFQVLFETDAIRGHSTRAIRGSFDAVEALRLMLEGSGLIFEFINERTIAVKPQTVEGARQVAPARAEAHPRRESDRPA